MDLSKVSTADLQAYLNGDLSKVSTNGLLILSGQTPKSLNSSSGEAAVDAGKSPVKIEQTTAVTTPNHPILIVSSFAEQLVPSIFWWFVVYLVLKKLTGNRPATKTMHLIGIVMVSLVGGLLLLYFIGSYFRLSQEMGGLVAAGLVPLVLSSIGFFLLPRNHRGDVSAIGKPVEPIARECPDFCV